MTLLMIDESMRHMDFIERVAQEDLRVLREKEATYRGSWKRRGGVGAFMMLARKWDRLENIVGSEGAASRYDVFAAVTAQPGGEDGTALAEIRDMRRYLLLVEAEMTARGAVPGPEVVRRVPRYDRPVVTDTGHDIPQHGHGSEVRAGTPEDGGQHVRAATAIPDRLEDGLLYHANDGTYVAVKDPVSNCVYYNVDRRRARAEDIDHLPVLRTEVNGAEWQQLAPEYRGMYEWVEGETKYRLRNTWACWAEDLRAA